MTEGLSQRRSFTPAQLLLGNPPTKKCSPPKRVGDAPGVVEDAEITLVEHRDIAPSKGTLSPVDLTRLLSGNRKRESFIVTLKLPPKRPHYWVTLKLPHNSSALEFKQKKKPKLTPTSISHPFFQNVYNRMSKAEKDKKIQQSSTIELNTSSNKFNLPNPERHTFKHLNLTLQEKSWLHHIETENRDKSSIFDTLQPRNLYPNTRDMETELISPTASSNMEFLLFYSQYKQSQHSQSNSFANTSYIHTVDDTSSDSIILQRYSHLQTDDRFAKFFDRNYCDQRSSNTTHQWCDLYSPSSHLENMQKEFISSDVSAWFTRSFSMLKKVNEKARRNKLTRKKSNKAEALESFIVFSDDETDDDGNGAMHDSHVPALIIEGPIGCGKTTMIHSVVVNELGGHVFEFNSSTSRARKDLEFNLRQIGTTTMVPKANLTNNTSSETLAIPNNDNDKTAILFDDVDLIDNSANDRDKDFWQGVTNLLSFSYRPVVLITNETSKIPSNIVNEATIYCFQSISSEDLFHYLDLVALSRGVNIDSSILRRFSHLNLREALMNLQMFTYRFKLSNVGLNSITEVTNDASMSKDRPAISNLEELSLLALQTDIQHFQEVTQRATSLEPSPETEDTALKVFKHAKYSYCDFYSSKLFSNGSRARICRYVSADDYNKLHPGNVFVTLPAHKLATEVIPLIETMVEHERDRLNAGHGHHSRFDMNPDDLDFPWGSS